MRNISTDMPGNLSRRGWLATTGCAFAGLFGGIYPSFGRSAIDRYGHQHLLAPRLRDLIALQDNEFIIDEAWSNLDHFFAVFSDDPTFHTSGGPIMLGGEAIHVAFDFIPSKAKSAVWELGNWEMDSLDGGPTWSMSSNSPHQMVERTKEVLATLHGIMPSESRRLEPAVLDPDVLRLALAFHRAGILDRFWSSPFWRAAFSSSELSGYWTFHELVLSGEITQRRIFFEQCLLNRGAIPKESLEKSGKRFFSRYHGVTFTHVLEGLRLPLPPCDV